MHRAAFILTVAAGPLTAADAQVRGGWMLEVEYTPGSGGVVSPAFPEATVRLLAWFEHAYAFGGGDGDVVADDGAWRDVRLIPTHNPPMIPPGMTPGAISGSRVELFIVGHVLCLPPCPPSTANPIPLWEGTWAADEFTPRHVRILTENTARFAIWDQTGRSHLIEPATLGSAAVRVVPAPWTAGLLAAAGVLVLRRRRTEPGGGNIREETERCCREFSR